MEWITLVAIVVSILLVGFFSGIEIAFVSANRLSIELNKKQGTSPGKIWGRFSDEPSKFIGSMMIGFNVMLIIYGLLVGTLLLPLWTVIEKELPASAADYVNYIKLLVETSISTLIILLIIFSFRAIFRIKNNAVVQSGLMSFFADVFYWAFAPFTAMFTKASEWMLKYIFNVKLHEGNDAFSKVDLENYLQQSRHHDEEEISELNKELFENALSLSEVKLRECLIPRKEIEGIEFSSHMQQVHQRFIDTQLSKLIVYEGSIDNIVGYIHQLDLFRHPQSVKEILLPIATVPESMNVTDMLNKFTKDRKTIAWVVDEFGGTAGIVTMEDLLEEIFGEIRDEYDSHEEFIDRQISNNEYIFSGRIELDYLTEKYDLHFGQDENTETLSGYIIQAHESIPKQKERIIIDNYEYDILSVTGTRIETVKLKVLN